MDGSTSDGHNTHGTPDVNADADTASGGAPEDSGESADDDSPESPTADESGDPADDHPGG